MPEWQRAAFSDLRALILKTVPGVQEEIKWRKPSNPDGSPVWSYHGILCVGNVWKDHVRLTFSNGGQLKDPKHVFNAALNGNYMRALDLREGDSFDKPAVAELLRAAVSYNNRELAKRERKS